MGDALKILGAAALTTTSAAIYTPAAGASAMISSFRLVNTSTTTSVTVEGTVGNSSTRVIPRYLSLNAQEMYTDSDPITLDSSQAMKFYATAATVDCTIFGIEHT
jgi:SH3-like domain-containing protein